MKNLAQLVPSLDILEVETAIGFNFLRTNIDGEDVGEEGTYFRHFRDCLDLVTVKSVKTV